jgi:hypothetical protein
VRFGRRSAGFLHIYPAAQAPVPIQSARARARHSIYLLRTDRQLLAYHPPRRRFPNPPEFIVGPLSTVTDPYLNLFRGIIPPLGGTIDLSPILAFVTLDLFTNAAAALPAEVDAEGNLVRAAPRGPRLPWAPRRGAGSAAQ